MFSLHVSGVITPKTGLQWQQPFLELVLACMHVQSATHEELLGPLKNQLSTFLAAFDKVGSVMLCFFFIVIFLSLFIGGDAE